MPKGLRLKRTPAEEAERDLRKARKAAKKASLRQRGAQKADLDVKDVNLDNAFPDVGPSTSRAAGTVDDDAFDEKLWDALGDDDRLDTIEAQLNDYGHVPRRWRSASSQAYDQNTMAGPDDDPRLMDDDEYAEWVRMGMWRRRNAAAHREQQRQKAAQASARTEAARILKRKEDVRRREHEDRERRRKADARDTYERRWVELLESKSVDLGFGDVPWPMQGKADVSLLTVEVISEFLFPICLDEPEGGGRGRTRREELRGTMLRFHPDKFEGRVIPRVKVEEKEAVREGANAVTRAVAALMEMDNKR